MHRLPKSGTRSILGHDVIFQEVNSLDDGKSLGECDADNNIIRIVKGQSRQSKRDTVVHETIEYINAKLDLKFTHKQIVQLTTGIMSIKDKK